jgi:hypothetical protein
LVLEKAWDDYFENLWDSNNLIYHHMIELKRKIHANSNHRLTFISHQPKKRNVCFPLPFAANKWKLEVFTFLLRKTNGSCHFPFAEFRKGGDMET